MCLLVSLLLNIIVVFLPVEASLCPKQNQSDEPRFTKELGNVDYVRISHSIHVPCCAEGYQSITWSKYVNGTWQKIPPPSLQHDGPEIFDNGQVLLFSDIGSTDSGTYKCTVHGHSKSIFHQTKIVVEECDKLARGPYLVEPFPENKTIYNYGGSVSLHCTGYFGCREPGDADIVLWKVEGSDKNITSISPRYIVNNTEDDRPDKLTVGATLTINSVHKEDVDRTFICIIASPQRFVGQTYKKVRIFKKDKPLTELQLGLIIGSCAFLFGIIVTVLCLRHFYGPRIQLFCSSRLDLCGLKTIENEEIFYNLFIYHAEEDETKAQEIKHYLTDKGYKVFIAADMQGNENIMHKVFEKTAKSALAVFLYSNTLRDDDLANFFLQSMIRSRKGKGILILEVEAYRPIQIREWQETHAENIRVLREQYNSQQEHNVHNDLNDNTEHNIEIGTEVTEQMADDLQFWKVLPRIKVPKDDEKGRKVSNFWCALQNKIPKFPYQKQKNGRRHQIKQGRSSLSRPLLNSTRESETLTPQSITNNGGEISPSGNEVFTFEDSNELVDNLPNTKRRNNTENLLTYEEETNLVASAEKIGNNAREFVSNEANSINCNVKSELSGERSSNDLLYNLDDHHHEKSNDVAPVVKDFQHQGHDINHTEDEGNYREDALKGKEDIFTMSGEEAKSGSFDSESGYGGEQCSGRGRGYTSSESGESSHYGMVSSHSSGFSDFNSDLSSPRLCSSLQNEPYFGHINARTDTQHIVNGTTDGQLYCENSNVVAGKGHNNRTKLIMTSPGNRSDSCSSESGYNTSPDRILSNDSYLPQINENIERGTDSLVDQ